MGDAPLMGNLVCAGDTVRIFKDFEELKTAVGSEVGARTTFVAKIWFALN